MKNLIYIKKCLGQNRKPLDIYKIRTMKQSSQDEVERLVLINRFDSFGKIQEDPRVTFLGKFLRRYFIDELPQLYNLAEREIKLVGIRPMEEHIWNNYPKNIMDRALKQKPGFMGIDYAFPHSNSFKDKLEHMEEYLDLWEKNPNKTDKDFFWRIFNNLVFKGVRSR